MEISRDGQYIFSREWLDYNAEMEEDLGLISGNCYVGSPYRILEIMVSKIL